MGSHDGVILAGAQNEGKLTLKMTLKWILPLSPSAIPSFLSISCRRLSAAVVCSLSSVPLMAHIEQHIDKVCSWPTTFPCNTKVEDANSLRQHLSDARGLWKAEWRTFGRKRAVRRIRTKLIRCPHPIRVMPEKTYETGRQVHRVVSTSQGGVSRSTFFKAATSGQRESVRKHRGGLHGSANRDGFHRLPRYCHGRFFRSRPAASVEVFVPMRMA
jgi:hypothetical protein